MSLNSRRTMFNPRKDFTFIHLLLLLLLLVVQNVCALLLSVFHCMQTARVCDIYVKYIDMSILSGLGIYSGISCGLCELLLKT